MHPYSHYRLRLLKDCVRILVVPTTVLYGILRIFDVHLALFTLPGYLIFIVLWAYVASEYSDRSHAREAKRLGGRPVPKVVGKWPGNIDILLRIIQQSRTAYFASVYQSFFEEYQTTTLNLNLMWRDVIITMDEEHSKFILATGFNNFWRGRAQKERMETFLGEGIFNRDEQEWKTHRALARPFFARDRITDFETFEKYTMSTISLISTLTSSGQPVEVQDLYARFTLDTASEFLFGKNLDTLSGKLPVPGKAVMSSKGSATEDEFGSFAQAFEDVQTIVLMRMRRGYFWPLLEIFQDSTLPHMDVIHKWLDPLVERVLKNKANMKEAGVQNSADQSTFLDYLAENTEDRDVIRDQLLNILLASRDTTSSLLTSVTYFMAMHPEVAKKLRAEVLEHCGPDGAPTFETVKKMKYMRAVLNEALRLFPPVPSNSRETRDSGVLMPPSDGTYPEPPEPLYIPGQTPFLWFTFLIQRNPTHWGPDADVFDPERWLDERVNKYTKNPMMFTPFSAGPRICIGQNYALNEATCFLVRLMQQFDTFTLAPECQPAGSLPPPEWKSRKGRQAIEKMWPDSALTAYVKGGLWVRFSKAQ